MDDEHHQFSSPCCIGSDTRVQDTFTFGILALVVASLVVMETIISVILYLCTEFRLMNASQAQLLVHVGPAGGQLSLMDVHSLGKGV